jgi:MFS family permease
VSRSGNGTRVRRRLPLLALAFANAVSLLGNVVAAVAIPFFVLVTTGSPARMGVAAFFSTLPLALGALAGGVVVDRLGARVTSVASDLASGAAIAGIPLLHALDRLEFWHVLALAFTGAVFDAPGQAAREALLPEVARRSGTPLERATALWTTTEHIGYLVGAPVAGIAIAVAGAPAALWLDVGSFAISALVVAVAVPAVAVAGARPTYLRGIVDGLRFVAQDATLRTFLAIATVGNFLIAPLAPVLLPLYAQQRLGGAGDLGILVGAYGAGGLVGAAAFGIAAGYASRRALFVGFWGAYPLVWLLLVLLPSRLLAALVLLLMGILAGALGPLEQVVRQERTPAELRGRVFSTFTASLTFVVPPAVLAAGLVVDAVGLRAAVALLAAGNVVLGIVAIRSRAGRDLVAQSN